MSEIKHVSYEKALEMGPERFVEDYLFPTMRRSDGNGFTMQVWNGRTPTGLHFHADEVIHVGQACNTAGCIGGTMEVILGFDRFSGNVSKMARVLEISHEQADGLFYRWGGIGSSEIKKGLHRWPADLRKKFKEAKTPLEKEQVAEKVILRVLKTKGACLNPGRSQRG